MHWPKRCGDASASAPQQPHAATAHLLRKTHRLSLDFRGVPHLIFLQRLQIHWRASQPCRGFPTHLGSNLQWPRVCLVPPIWPRCLLRTIPHHRDAHQKRRDHKLGRAFPYCKGSVSIEPIEIQTISMFVLNIPQINVVLHPWSTRYPPTILMPW